MSRPKIGAFRRLHEQGCFVMPNPWDIGSARVLAQMGFRALATTSAGFAWCLGCADNRVRLEDALDHYRAISAAVAVPVNADFEDAFAIEPSAVATNVALAASTGVAGLSVEDSVRDAGEPLQPFSLAVERVRAAREAIDGSGTGVLLTGRSEGFIVGRPDLKETIRRLTAYSAAGADCLFAPGIKSPEEIREVVAAVAPKPVNVVVSGDFTTVKDLAAMGVRRISVGGALARVAWTGFLEAAAEIAERGTFSALGRAVPGAAINAKFSGS
jgi:2-methylisocitrate lyase-like PEP mutase family enzyme